MPDFKKHDPNPATSALTGGEASHPAGLPNGQRNGGDATGCVPKRAGEKAAPLSFAQQQLWFLNRLEPEDPLYNVLYAIRLRGQLEATVLERCWQEIVRRHEILRTTFQSEGNGPVQVTGREAGLVLQRTDLQGVPADRRLAEAHRLAAEEARKPLDLETGPLLRVRLMRLAGDDHLLVVALHHIVFDNYSEGVLSGELSQLYEVFRAGGDSPLPALPLQYADYSRSQRERWSAGELNQALEYWKQKLAGQPETLELPADWPEPPVRTPRGEVAGAWLDAQTSGMLRGLGQTTGAGLPATLLAAFKAFLCRYTGQTDLTVGVPVDERHPAETQRLIGFFVNTLPMRDDVSGNPTFRGLIARVARTMNEALANAGPPFEKLVEVLQPERVLSRNPLFRVMFAHQPAPFASLRLPGLEVEVEEFFSATSKFDLTLFVIESAAGLQLRIEYSTDLFEAATIRRWLGHFQCLLADAAARPDARLSELQLLGTAERHELVTRWNETRAEYPADACVHQLVETQVERTPDDVAAVSGPDQLTYRKLDAQAGQLAACLRALGVGPDVCVGLCVERSLDMLVGVLGILKAGGCYVPLDPDYPVERLAGMLKDSGAKVLLTQRKLAAQLPRTGATVVYLDEPLPVPPAGAAATSAPVTPDHLAYVIYTSGSTGQPKGVAMTHRALVNLITWQLKESKAGRRSRTAQFTSLSFDVSFQEIFSTWCSGGTLVLVAQSVRRDPRALWKLLADARVERLFLPFVALQQLAEVAGESDVTPRHLREVITAGEQLQTTTKIVAMFEKLPGCTLHNHYGPTESHVVTAHTLQGPPRSWPTLPPIGRPISNTRIHVLDALQQPTPIGVPGELHIGGVCLARGYLNQPDLSARKFIPDPLGGEAGAKLYRTGDLARYLPDGNIEFLGRLDDQLKLRGFRVEPGEIEDALRQHAQVRDGVVVARGISPGDKRLVAYLTFRGSQVPAPAELREHLRKRLPDYMVPSSFVTLARLPLTPSGKVNRRALAEAGGEHPEAPEKFTPPRTPVEQTLAAIWGEVLKRKNVGIHDNFFDLGGHSLLAMQVIDQVSQAGLGLSLNQLFEYQTIAELAEVANTNQTVEAGSEEWFSLVTLQPKGTKPPFFLLHTTPGDLLGYMKLVYHLGSDQPCYGFQSYGLLRQGASHQRLEDMAAHYVRLLREFQPKGPYYLGGWCFGGNVAMEMAWQLVDQGQQVALLVVMEGWALPPPVRYWRYYWHRLLGLAKRGPHGVLRRYVGKFSHYFGHGDEAQERKVEFAFENTRTGPLANREHVYQVNLRASDSYRSRPAVFPGRVTLFLREDFGDDEVIAKDCGFATLARETKTYLLPGDHLGVLKEPHVKLLARQLKECLAEAQAAAAAPAGVQRATETSPEESHGRRRG